MPGPTAMISISVIPPTMSKHLDQCTRNNVPNKGGRQPREPSPAYLPPARRTQRKPQSSEATQASL